MIHSKRSHEGYLLSDLRHSGGALLESATITCSHCHRQLLVNPARTRAREWCPKCDHYLCDRCGLIRKLDGGACEPLKAKMDRLQNEAAILIGKG